MGPLKCGETIKTLSFPFHLLLLLLVLLATRLVFVACARQFIVDYFAINVVQKKKKKKKKKQKIKKAYGNETQVGSHRAYEEGIIRAYKERRGVAKSKPSEKKDARHLNLCTLLF